MVITSTIGNRVVRKTGTWVQIPPSPPKIKTVLLGRFLFFMILDLKTRARRARGGRCRALPVEDEARHKEGQKHSENKRVVRAKFELMFQPARLARNPTVSAINKTVL